MDFLEKRVTRFKLFLKTNSHLLNGGPQGEKKFSCKKKGGGVTLFLPAIVLGAGLQKIVNKTMGGVFPKKFSMKMMFWVFFPKFSIFFMIFLVFLMASFFFFFKTTL